jgi:hypothetical protein
VGECNIHKTESFKSISDTTCGTRVTFSSLYIYILSEEGLWLTNHYVILDI